MLNLHSICFFIFKLLYIQQALCLPLENNTRIIYDQRQTGKYNIQISIKDVAIIEVDRNEFIDDTINNSDEYYYDDDDLTVKPISTWMVSSTTTIKSPALISTSTKEPIDSQVVTNKQEVNVLNLSPQTNTTNTGIINSSFNLSANSLFPSSTRSWIPSDTAVLLVTKPVVHDQNVMQEIPHLHTAKRSRQDTSSIIHGAPNMFEKVKEKDSTILKIITAQPLLIKKLAICKTNYFADSNGNCRKKRRLSFLKSFFDMLKLIRIKEI